MTSSTSSTVLLGGPGKQQQQPVELVPQFQEMVLDAIDQLRRRKARPDAERIYNTLSRRHDFSFDNARTALDRCVLNGTVLRVEYKGNISYRNAAKKFSHLKLRLDAEKGTGGGAIMRHKQPISRKFNGVLTEAFAALVLQEPDYLEAGISKTELIRNILERDSVKYTGKYITMLLEKEIEAGGVSLLENGNYVLRRSANYHQTGRKAFRQQHTTAPTIISSSTPHSVSATSSGGCVGDITIGTVSDSGNESYVHRSNTSFSTSTELTISAEIKTYQNRSHAELFSPRIHHDETRYTATVETSTIDKPIGHVRDSHRDYSRSTITATSPEKVASVNSVLTSPTTPSRNVHGGSNVRPRVHLPKSTAMVGSSSSKTMMSQGGSSSMGTPLRKKPGPKPKNHLKLTAMKQFSSMDSNLRIGGRRKRAKKVFDPSENNMPRKRGRPAGSLNRTTMERQAAAAAMQTPKHSAPASPVKSDPDSRPDSRSSMGSTSLTGVCSVCHFTQKRGTIDKLISCRECSNKAHVSCLNGEDMMLRMSPDNTWQCPHCKTCVVCYETSGAGCFAVCSVCADAYHLGCHKPPLAEKVRSTSKWLCMNCDNPSSLAVKDIQLGIKIETMATNSMDAADSNSTIKSERQSTRGQLSPDTAEHRSPVQSSDEDDKYSNPDDAPVESDEDDSAWNFHENIDPTIPNAYDWTTNEVYDYFVQYFPDEAIIFKEQDIDGRSLLLLRRMDVLKNLKLKLGPALKIYRHVLKLQYRRDDPKLFWT